MSEHLDEATTLLLRSASGQVPVTSKSVTVAVVEGPSAGAKFTFDDLAHRQVLVGHSSTCDVRIADKTVSRRHAGLRLVDRGVVVEDLESSNGTTVNGVLVERAVLRGGELVRLGSSALRVEVGEEQRVLAASEAAHFGSFLGASASARRLYVALERLSQAGVPVLLEGEAGTGKELLAEALHERGPRADQPFLVLERSTGGEREMERALFGVGSFEPGLLERARGGTLFVDEIGDLELPIQLKLLRALEARSARRVDGTEAYEVDVRLIVATRRDLDRDVQARRFREELLALLSPGRIEVPPLRRRKGDIALLVKVFWGRFGGDPAELSPALVQRFEGHRWPGNVRELATAVATHLVDGDVALGVSAAPAEPPDGRASADRAPDMIDAILARGLPIARARQEVAAELEARYLTYMLKLHGGNVSRAAAASGMSRRHYYRLKSKAP
jgi:two-component system, NtrC family, response regulator HydG